MPMLARFEGIAKRYSNGIDALRGFDLEIEDNSFVSLLGPSGCGKSTALRLLAGLDKPTDGQIVWRDRQPEIGFVFQEPTLMPWATLFDNVWLPLRLKGHSRRVAAPAIDAMLEKVGLSGFAKAVPGELSGGMRMRTALARALVTRPPLLLMDEPFAALDEITRLRLNDDLLRLQRETGATIVFVTHSVFESVYLATRIAVVSSRPGRVTRSFSIEGPDVRDASFRLSPTYTGQCGMVSHALDQAMQEHAR